jgi:hypothetical protein
MNEPKIAQEFAEQEFDRFLNAMDLDIQLKGMDDEDRKSFEEAKRKLVRAMQKGSLVIDEKGQPVFTPQLGDTAPITFKEPTGAVLMTMDQKKKDHDVAKMMVTMAAMTGVNMQRFAKMEGRDIKICLAIATLFLG